MLKVGLEVLIFFSVIFSIIRSGSIEDFRYFLTPADVKAMSWIEANTPKDAVFAINTYMWLGNSPHGTDGGYWIPYFTQRRTTTGTMMFNYGSKAYTQKIITQSLAVIDLSEHYQSINGICQEGINYIYLGVKRNFSGKNLDPSRLGVIPGVIEAYENENVTIFKLNCR